MVPLVAIKHSVAYSFTQADDIHHSNTFSLKAHLNSIWVKLSLVIYYSLILAQLDVTNAFLYDDLFENIFMEER